MRGDPTCRLASKIAAGFPDRIGVCATGESRLDHSLDETVDVFASVAKLSPIGCCSPRASFESASGGVKSEPRFHACKPQIFDADFSGDNRLREIGNVLFLEEYLSELFVQFLVSVSLPSLPQQRLHNIRVDLPPRDQVLRSSQHAEGRGAVFKEPCTEGTLHLQNLHRSPDVRVIGC